MSMSARARGSSNSRLAEIQENGDSVVNSRSLRSARRANLQRTDHHVVTDEVNPNLSVGLQAGMANNEAQSLGLKALNIVNGIDSSSLEKVSNDIAANARKQITLEGMQGEGVSSYVDWGVETVVDAAPTVVAGVAGGIAGPVGVAAASGAVAGLEAAGASVLPVLLENGVDVTDGNAVYAALQDEGIQANLNEAAFSDGVRTAGITAGAALGGGGTC